jgi:hypothetical protein
MPHTFEYGQAFKHRSAAGKWHFRHTLRFLATNALGASLLARGAPRESIGPEVM